MSRPIVEEPRINEFLIEAPPRPFKKTARRVKHSRLKPLDIDAKCEEDLSSNKGFFITNEAMFDSKDKPTIDGLMSKKYGPDTFSTDSVNDDEFYKCDCNALNGQLYLGDICPECETEVRYVDDLSITGYIELGGYKVISPSCYLMVESLISKKTLTSILKYSTKFNENGVQIDVTSKKEPYKGIGMIGFYERFDEIIEFYVKRRKDKIQNYEFLKQYRNAVFSGYVNPYNARLRPAPIDDSKLCLFKVNKLYNIIVANANIVKSGIDERSLIEGSLYEIQERWNAIFDTIRENDLDKKKGLLRGKITCARVSDSARLLIIPGRGLKFNEIELPYIPMVELLRPLLINKLVKLDSLNHRDANSIVDEAMRKFDRRIWMLMNYIIRNSKQPIEALIQRSPSLILESIRQMKIKCIKADYHDLTMTVPVSILDGQNADFDGDQLAVFILYDRRLIQAWSFLHGARHHLISRNTGMYSEYCKFIKDTAVILSELWEIGKNTTYYTEWASEEEMNLKISSFE